MKIRARHGKREKFISMLLVPLIMAVMLFVPVSMEHSYGLDIDNVISSIKVGGIDANRVALYTYDCKTSTLAGATGIVTLNLASSTAYKLSGDDPLYTVSSTASYIEITNITVASGNTAITFDYQITKNCKVASIGLNLQVYACVDPESADPVYSESPTTFPVGISLYSMANEVVKAANLDSEVYDFSSYDLTSDFLTEANSGTISVTPGDGYSFTSVDFSLISSGSADNIVFSEPGTTSTSFAGLKDNAVINAKVTLGSGEELDVRFNIRRPSWSDMVTITVDGTEQNSPVTAQRDNSDNFSLFFRANTSERTGVIVFSAASGYSIDSFSGPEISVSMTSYGEMDVVQAYSMDTPVTSFNPSEATISYGSLDGTEPLISTLAIKKDDSGVTKTIVSQIDMTYVDPTPSYSGGGGDSGGSDDYDPPAPAETINVINEDNPENLSNDTILTSNHTVESGDTSTTTVSSAEAQALIDLAERHEGDIDVAEGDHEAVINVESQGGEEIDTYVVSISAQDEQKIEDSVIDVLSMATPIGDFRIRTDELDSQTDSKPADLKMTLERTEHEGRAALEVKLELGQNVVRTFYDEYNVEIRIPYTPAEDEDVNGLIIEYVATNGDTFIISESHYDADTGMLCFFAPHLSKYGVSYKPKQFSDVKTSHWASGYITFLAARGVVSGMGDGKFQPDAKVTKAQFITMMTNAFSKANLGSKPVKSYKDVKTTDWYAKQMGWSYINNLSNVLAKNGYIYPNANLTREDMATLSNNISLGLSLRLKMTEAQTSFSDASGISAYAISGVQRMVACGILNGSGGKFFPKDGLTRAEAAKVISVLISSMK